MELGKIQSLKVDRKKDFGVYLTDGNGEDVLLPMKEVPEGCEVGSEIEVFVYRDSKDRLIATTRRPKILVGEVGRLLVKSTTGIGAFLDIGLERDVLLPFYTGCLAKDVNRPLHWLQVCYSYPHKDIQVSHLPLLPYSQSP